MLIREVILENFMSYEYARIPLKEGVNVVCGPNGSGKSSLLLGICVALGDTYTERSKKLSDLIRWGSDTARVTLNLNNSVGENGYRPVPQYNMDEITLTRTLRVDGKYGFQLNQTKRIQSRGSGTAQDLWIRPQQHANHHASGDAQQVRQHQPQGEARDTGRSCWVRLLQTGRLGSEEQAEWGPERGT